MDKNLIVLNYYIINCLIIELSHKQFSFSKELTSLSVPVEMVASVGLGWQVAHHSLCLHHSESSPLAQVTDLKMQPGVQIIR